MDKQTLISRIASILRYDSASVTPNKVDEVLNGYRTLGDAYDELYGERIGQMDKFVRAIQKYIDGSATGGAKSMTTTKKEYMDCKSWSASGNWANVRSKKVSGIRYHKGARRLFVEYKDGSVRSYERVHPMTARALFNTLKVDKFLEKRIIMKHMTVRIR